MFDAFGDRELTGRLPLGYGGLFYGVYPALVTNVVDPAGMGQIQVQLPWSPDSDQGTYQVWARLATLMAGNTRGTWFIPDVGDEVLVTFAAGNPRYPIVLGALWNGKDAAPVQMDQDGKNDIKQIRSRTGVEITLDDTQDKSTLTLTTPGKQQAVFSDDSEKKGLQLQDSNSGGDAAKTNTLTFSSKGITLTAGDQYPVTVTDGYQNAATLDQNGIKLADKNQNTVVMSSDGVAVTDANQNKVTMASAGITLELPSGNKIAITASGITLSLASGASVQLSDSGFAVSNVAQASVQAMGQISLTAQGEISMSTLGTCGIQAAGAMDVTASDVGITGSMISLTGGLIEAAGVINCPTIIAEAVVATSYTPGAGNIL